MPLIILTGYPSVGKTTNSLKLKEWFEKKLSAQGYLGPSMKITIVGDLSQGISKLSYGDALEEKKARGSIISAVERHLAKNVIVIVDSLNYIKGFRYQLYCISRSIGTPHCVVYTAAPVEYCRQANENQLVPYSSEIFENLITRYEEPNCSSRWDSPLFTILQHIPEENIPFQEIWEAVIEKKAPLPNLATAIDPVTESNFLLVLEQSTKDIIQKIMDAQNTGINVVNIPGIDSKIYL
ncbi:hypothetical protein BB561_004202 [Smittium simulii]|uniref:Chromatin associated protein KTI12 n=1 Tax=Smittium simulii TaxID=133385 RepID=A0A2T9YHK4_9FUNG|nr:hypothetical protein BB561_004202 [Smittium simulii]